MTTVAEMSEAAQKLNDAYLDEMRTGRTVVMERIRDLWWADYEAACAAKGFPYALNRLDEFMGVGRDRLATMAVDYATDAGHDAGSDKFRQVATQFIKSNTGKMFERLVGLALALALKESDSAYCIYGCRAETLRLCHNLTREDLEVKFVFGDGTLKTHIDADLFAFNPTKADDEIFLISIKSTLKDRFHNVPFWNMLRRAAVSDDFADIQATNRDELAKMRYVAVCSDLAAEQPDFGSDAGARNLLKIDAAMLDGAYVTASKAKGLPTDCTDHLGDVREHAFYWYSCFYEYLMTKTE